MCIYILQNTLNELLHGIGGPYSLKFAYVGHKMEVPRHKLDVYMMQS